MLIKLIDFIIFHVPPSSAHGPITILPQSSYLKKHDTKQICISSTMTTRKRNDYLDIGSSDSDESDRGYDSEAAQETKGASITKPSGSISVLERGSKRRKLGIREVGEDSNWFETERESLEALSNEGQDKEDDTSDGGDESNKDPRSIHSASPKAGFLLSTSSKTTTLKTRKNKTGVIYLSSLPPYLKPSALKSLLTARGFGPITKVFLSPSTPDRDGGPKPRNRRRTYVDGWLEFASKRTAKICAQTLNATIVGGRKGGWYHDDVWNMKYLRGFKWADLMEQVQRERAERDAVRRIEDAKARKEEKLFLAGVERGKVVEGIRKKREEQRKKRGAGEETGGERIRRVFRQNEVRGGSDKTKGVEGVSKLGETELVDRDAQRILAKIF